MSTAHQTLPTSGSHVHTLGILKTHILDLEGRIHALKEEKLAAERLVSAIEGSESAHPSVPRVAGPTHLETLKKFGALSNISGFEWRQPQKEVVLATLCKKDVVAVIPTGGGKTFTYTLPAQGARDGAITVVIQPLQRLIQQQVSRINARAGRVIAVHTLDLSTIHPFPWVSFFPLQLERR